MQKQKRLFIKKSLLGLGGIMTTEAVSCLSPSANKEDKIWKWSKESRYYTATPRGVMCNLCPNNCNIKDGESGDCHNMINYGGKLYSIAYGNPCAVHVDPIEKKPLYHFYPQSKVFSIGTAGCNMACLNCQNWSISQKSPRETKNHELWPKNVPSLALTHNCKSVAYTYTEPFSFYEYTYDSSKLSKKQNLKNILVTNGYVNEKPLQDIVPYIDAANVDLKSFDNNIYMRLNAGTLKPILRTLKILKENNVWLEITNLIIPDWTDDMKMISEMCRWLKDNGFEYNPLHFSRFHPAYKLKNIPSTPVSTIKKAKDIAQKAGIKYVYVGNVRGDDGENTYCHNCGKLLINRNGYVIEKNSIKDGKCHSCGAEVPGRWFD